VTTLDTKRNPLDLEKIAHLTLEHYNQYTEEFWQGTRDHDVSQNIAALLQYIRNEPPFKILDFGCGPGRDLKTFAPVYRHWMCEQVGCNGELLSTGESITRLSTSWKHRCGKCGHEDWADATYPRVAYLPIDAIGPDDSYI
jgi:hypothetical protein